MQDLDDLSAIMSRHSSSMAANNQPCGLRKIETQTSAIAQLVNALILNGEGGKKSERAEAASVRVEENKAEPEVEVEAKV